MGERLAMLQELLNKTGPLRVSGPIGGQLTSNFELIISGFRQINDKQVALLSGTGEIILDEEEIYQLRQDEYGNGFRLTMDGGTELSFILAN